VYDLAHVKPMHVAGYVESLLPGFAKPTVKQHLAAIRMLFDWLVVGHIIDVNLAHAVRGPKHVVKKGRTPDAAGRLPNDSAARAAGRHQDPHR